MDHVHIVDHMQFTCGSCAHHIEVLCMHVPSNHVGCHVEGGVSCPCQPEVQDLQTTVLLDHDVTGLEVLEGEDIHV